MGRFTNLWERLEMLENTQMIRQRGRTERPSSTKVLIKGVRVSKLPLSNRGGGVETSPSTDLGFWAHLLRLDTLDFFTF